MGRKLTGKAPSPTHGVQESRVGRYGLTEDQMALIILAGDCYTADEFVNRYGLNWRNWPHRSVLVRWTDLDLTGGRLSTWDKQAGWIRCR